MPPARGHVARRRGPCLSPRSLLTFLSRGFLQPISAIIMAQFARTSKFRARTPLNRARNHADSPRSPLIAPAAARARWRCAFRSARRPSGPPRPPAAAQRRKRSCPRARRAGKAAICSFGRLRAARSRARALVFAGARRQEGRHHGREAAAHGGRPERRAGGRPGCAHRRAHRGAGARARPDLRCAGPGPTRACTRLWGRERAAPAR